ncbi:MAG TPA: hypothetical protein VNO17_04865, partial [Actinomycetota bacterium]|nr:hypothetical protein [Actinomycetota bacterium]
TRRPAVAGATDPLGGLRPVWPSVQRPPDGRVPLVLAGTGLRRSGTVAAGTRLDAVAPTVAAILGFRRPHPEVRSGRPVRGLASGAGSRLVVLVAWKGVGTADLLRARRDWPFLRSLLRTGAGTLRADAGSLPLDPAAVLTTIGTGGLPAQHGITGTLLRDDRGGVTRAFGPGAPLPVIATLAEDLDAALGERPLVGLVAPDRADRGIVGGAWYVGHDRDLRVVGGDPVAGVGRLLRAGFGGDEVPDVLAVVLAGPVPAMDRATARVAALAREASGGRATLVVTATGSARAGGGVRTASELAEAVDAASGLGRPLVEAAGVGGLFLDQDVLLEAGVSGEVAVRALLRLRGPGGRLAADAFQGFAVSFGRFC